MGFWEERDSRAELEVAFWSSSSHEDSTVALFLVERGCRMPHGREVRCLGSRDHDRGRGAGCSDVRRRCSEVRRRSWAS